jgi:Listeria-Bacteroides repeat domain (List_Bact_rpt).
MDRTITPGMKSRRHSPQHYGLGQPGIALLLLASLGLYSCSAIQQTDLESFVETGLTMVSLRSVSFVSDSAELSRIPSGARVVAKLVLVNPKSFEVAYSLAWDGSDCLFDSCPVTAPTPSDATHLSFSFLLDPASAEHKTITFKLGKYVQSINKTYDEESFSIICDSPPNAPTRVATMMDGGQKSLLAILLPTATSDDDLAKLEVSWTIEGGSVLSSGTYDISAMRSAPASNPFSSRYDCYFQPEDCVAGYGYSYSVRLLDAAGQESSAATTSSTANLFYLNYDGNGNTGGSIPASVGYRYKAKAVVAEPGELAKASYAFYDWNTAADGSGKAYSPGDILEIPAGEVTLYAIWITNDTALTFDIGTQAIAFSAGAAKVRKGSVLTVNCVNQTLAAAGSDWKWYVDGSLAAVGSSSFSWNTAGAEVGQYVIGCSVRYRDLLYAGSFRATVVQ